jgi:MYXO-CTERM domain-containing protein
MHDFLAWLSARASRGTVVLPVDEAFLPPADPANPPPARPPGQPGSGPTSFAPGGGPDAGGCSTTGDGRAAPALGLAALALALRRRRQP